MNITDSPFHPEDTPTIKAIFEGDLQARIHQIQDDACLIEGLRTQTHQWQQQGNVVVFTAGVFDILHANHLLGLTHYRLLGAHEYLTRQGIAHPSQEQLHDTAASDAVRLIVSVDTDKRVARDKGFLKAKGDCPKPVVSWENRVMLLAHQQIAGPTGTARALIDYITRHGDDADACGDLACPHIDNSYIAQEIQPDIVVVNNESSKTLTRLQAVPSASKTKLIVIDENSLTYQDKLLQGPLKSSAIIRRAKLTPSQTVV